MWGRHPRAAAPRLTSRRRTRTGGTPATFADPGPERDNLSQRDDVALCVRDLHKRFGDLDVLKGVDLTLRAGEIVALVGENGSGKSTVVQCVARVSSPDRGTFSLNGVALSTDPVGAQNQGVAVVWQDLALCDNLGVVANLFLGAELQRRFLVSEAAMVAEAERLFDRLGLPPAHLERSVGTLSGGERQLVAIARAVRREPTVLVLDEPTAALGVNETAVVDRLLLQLRRRGTAILLVSHRLEQVFSLADRIAVLRGGRIVADVSRMEVHPDDVAAMIAGIETDSSARRQLRRLRSLVEQLAEVEPAASLPLIVSAMGEALSLERLCIHLLESGGDGEPARLRLSAALGLDPSAVDGVDALGVGEAGSPPGTAAATGEAVVVEDLAGDTSWHPFRSDGHDRVRSSWSIPIVGSGGVLGTVSGFGETVGRPQPDQLELAWLYASHAAAAIERERLLADATRRNRVLETLRGVLDTLAGPQPATDGMALTLLALCRGLGADSIALHHPDGECSELTPVELRPAVSAQATSRQLAAAAQVLGGGRRLERARPVGADVLAVPVAAPEGRAVVTAWWADPGRLSDDALDLLDDAARSLALALERRALEQIHAEADSLRRSQSLQRDFLSRLNHELRTPLTAIQGFASTLRQPDVTWDESSQQRFLESIASESERMGRLVGDLLDFSAIDSGTLRLVPDWCDLGLVVAAAARCVREEGLIVLGDFGAVPMVWADHDRLEQVFVNLFDNAARHALGVTRVDVTAEVDPGGAAVTVTVADDGAGMWTDTMVRMSEPRGRGASATAGAGLGLAIARGIVEAHCGTLALLASSAGTTIEVCLPIEPTGTEAGVPDRDAATADGGRTAPARGPGREP